MLYLLLYYGMVARMEPGVVEFNVPMSTGLVNAPAACDNCAVNTLPAFASSSIVNAIVTLVPTQIPVCAMGEVVIVVNAGKPAIQLLKINNMNDRRK